MKKVKKLLAMIMAMTMVLGMAMTVSAAPLTGEGDLTITVSGLTEDEETTVSAYKVVDWDDATNAWKVEPWATDCVNTATNPYEIDYAKLKDEGAYEGQTANATATAAEGVSSVVLENLDIGAYLIVATGTQTDYNAMGALTFTYNKDTGVFEAANTSVEAKGGDYSVTKTFVNSEGASYTVDFSKRGETVKFQIVTYYPSFEKDETNRQFIVTDNYTGMLITDVEVVSVGTTSEFAVGDITYSTLPTTTTGSVTVTFNEQFTAKGHAGQKVVINVTATVMGTDNVSQTEAYAYKNEATTNKIGDKKPSIVTGDNASLTITKKNEDETKVLPGAEFSISQNNAAIQLVKVSDGIYAVATPNEIADDEITKVTSAAVNAQGVLVIKGLDEGTYSINETKAPNGYSINENIEDVTIAPNGDATLLVDMAKTVTDSKLASLPSTGGIGTTIFTIGGCAIMIAAAALYFASKRKSEEN